MYDIEFSPMAAEHLKALRAFDRSRILEEIENQLAGQPAVRTKRKKTLQGLHPPWDQAAPVWQLRVGDCRVFYDVDKGRKLVTIHAVLWKGRRTTGEIL
jgi:mRNA-degrading endonuclease RelE of RelBE toxin-antitoxin system